MPADAIYTVHYSLGSTHTHIRVHVNHRLWFMAWFIPPTPPTHLLHCCTGAIGRAVCIALLTCITTRLHLCALEAWHARVPTKNCRSIACQLQAGSDLANRPTSHPVDAPKHVHETCVPLCRSLMHCLGCAYGCNRGLASTTDPNMLQAVVYGVSCPGHFLSIAGYCHLLKGHGGVVSCISWRAQLRVRLLCQAYIDTPHVW
jgi:hypothetical protein